jgi:hypothetical protein
MESSRRPFGALARVALVPGVDLASSDGLGAVQGDLDEFSIETPVLFGEFEAHVGRLSCAPRRG